MTQQQKTDMQGILMLFFVFAVVTGVIVFVFSTTKFNYN
jgi:hypothetical protein